MYIANDFGGGKNMIIPGYHISNLATRNHLYILSLIGRNDD